MKVVAISDTHAPRRWKACPPRVAEHLRGAGLILHAGDVCVPSVLDELAEYAPVLAVLGNNDGAEVAAWGAPATLETTIEGLEVAMVHDSGPASGRAQRMRTMFSRADLVIFGHSHIPWDTELAGQRLFNPGSPTDRRRQPHGTIGLLDITRGRLRSHQIVDVT